VIESRSKWDRAKVRLVDSVIAAWTMRVDCEYFHCMLVSDLPRFSIALIKHLLLSPSLCLGLTAEVNLIIEHASRR
jgi:hypothetical protein